MDKVLAWPDGSGLVWTMLLGAGAYVHTHMRLGRQHAERIEQAERHHREQMRQAEDEEVR